MTAPATEPATVIESAVHGRGRGGARCAGGARMWRGLEDVPRDLGRTVVTLGVFDGVHRGHARLIDHAVRRARSLGLPTVLVTFDPHPARLVGAPRDTSTLTTVARRAELVAELGVDAVLVLRFCRELAALQPDEFVSRVLSEHLHAAAVVVGANFTFGARGSGTVSTLEALAPRHGFTAHGIALLPVTDEPCSSTHTRKCLRRGDLAAAAAALGRPHEIEGELSGDTLTVPEQTALPTPGIYTVVVHDEETAEVSVLDDRRIRLLRPARANTDATTVRLVFYNRSDT